MLPSYPIPVEVKKLILATIPLEVFTDLLAEDKLALVDYNYTLTDKSFAEPPIQASIAQISLANQDPEVYNFLARIALIESNFYLN